MNGIHVDAPLAGIAPALDAEPAATRERDERLFVLVLLVSFPLFLIVAVSARLMPGGSPEAKPRGSIFAEAASTARATIAIAFND